MCLIHSKTVIASDFQDNVNNSNVGVNESIYFSFINYLPNDAIICLKMLLNVD